MRFNIFPLLAVVTTVSAVALETIPKANEYKSGDW